MKLFSFLKIGALALATSLMPLAVQAQFAGTPPSNGLHNLSLLKPPAGSKVAIVVFEDLGCPACAHAHPIELQVAAATHVPILRFDFPIEAHIWTQQGAVCARYIQIKSAPSSPMSIAAMSLPHRTLLPTETTCRGLQRTGCNAITSECLS